MNFHFTHILPHAARCILLLILVSGCGKKHDAAAVTVIVSGDTAGWIVPCGCTSNQSGGLPRRGTFVERWRQNGSVIVVDVGGAAGGTTEYDRMKFEAIIQGENAMGIAAHNLGRSEVDLGIEEIRRLHEKWNVPWISANATDGNGVSIATPFRIVEAERQKILLIGVLSREFKTNDIHVTPPLQAVLKSLRINAGKFDRAVVLAYVPEDELSVLAESLPEVDAVIGGPTGQPVPVEFPLGHVLTTSATKQGKFLVELTLPAMKDKSKPTLGKIVELDERFADDPTQLENVRQFYVSLKQRDLVPSQTPFVDELWNTTGTFSGSKACQNCHEEEYRGWNESRHAQAWQSLTKREAVYDPDCQRCHVTGYGLPGGFETVSRSADRVGVGCESCHGGSEEHCRKTAVRTPMEGRAKERCLACHDKENSPGFNEKEYWSKIRHGE